MLTMYPAESPLKGKAGIPPGLYPDGWYICGKWDGDDAVYIFPAGVYKTRDDALAAIKKATQ